MFHSLRWLPITDFCKDLAPNSFRMTWQTFRAICRMESLKVSLEFRPLRCVRISPSKLQSLLYPEKQQPQPQRRNQNKQQQATTTTTITTTTTTTGHKTRNHKSPDRGAWKLDAKPRDERSSRCQVEDFLGFLMGETSIHLDSVLMKGG